MLYAAEAGFFDYEELKLLKDLAGDISFALDYIGKEEKLTYVSYYDTLTGLANRQLFFDRLAQALHSARAERRQLAVMIIDLQRFKTDQRHPGTICRRPGSQGTRQPAAAHRSANPPPPRASAATASRWWSPILPGTSMARWIDDWIVDSFAEPIVIDEIELRTTVKIGIALYPADADTAESLFVNAEAALKRAKDAADPYLFYSPEMNARVAQRLHLESRLRKAVAQKEFVLHYQTKVDLATRRDPRAGGADPLERSRVRRGLAAGFRAAARGIRADRGSRALGDRAGGRRHRQRGDRWGWRCRAWR